MRRPGYLRLRVPIVTEPTPCQCESAGRYCSRWGKTVDPATWNVCQAYPQLAVARQNGEDGPRIDFGGDPILEPCRNLGPPLGRIAAPTGSLPVYRCDHPAMGETCGAECLGCDYRDREPSLPPTWDEMIPCNRTGRPVGRIATGVVTAPRFKSTIGATLQGLQAGGWERPLIFAEPGSLIPAGWEGDVIQRSRPLGCWANWWLSLSELWQLDPNADAYCVFQDDLGILPADRSGETFRQYVGRSLWPNPKADVASLYCSEAYAQSSQGWFRLDIPWVYGALAIVFTSTALIDFLRWSLPWALAAKEIDFTGVRNNDTCVGRWQAATGRAIYYPFPSLIQHMGDTSTVWAPERSRNEGRRKACLFVGDLTG